MKKPKKVKVVSEAAATPCPKCGYCQHCGQSKQPIHYVMPYVYPLTVPYYYPSYPTWTSGQMTITLCGTQMGAQSSLGSMQDLASYAGSLGSTLGAQSSLTGNLGLQTSTFNVQ